MKLLKKIIGFITLGVSALALTGCINMTVYADADKYVAGTQYYDGELTTLDIDWTSGSVTLIEDEHAGQIIVKEDNNLSEDKKVHSYFHDGILSVKFCKSGIRFGNVLSSDKQLFVTFPKLENLILDITSGKAAIEKLSAKSIKIEITSGELTLGQASCEEFESNMTSGSITVGNLNVANKAKFKTTSGKTTIDEITVKELSIKSTSGDIKLNVPTAEKIEIDVTSGNIDLTIPTAGATMKLSKTSGKFTSTRDHKVDNNNYVYGDGSCNITIHVTSGNVTIR